MIWKPPESEEAWDECLSTYLDGESSEEERRALEKYLAGDPLRAEQLEGLRATSRVLGQWRVEAPEPDAGFVREVRRTLAKRGSADRAGWFGGAFRGPLLRWALNGALYAAGIATGVGAMLARDDVSALRPNTMAAVQSTARGGASTDATSIAISPRQADRLLREVRASALKDRVVEGLDGKDWRVALKRYESLRDEYPDSLALRELNEGGKLRWAQVRYLANERI